MKYHINGRQHSLILVIAGLDPAIHPFFVKTSCEEDGCAGQARA
jgi:hypothetical protein